MKLLKFYTNTCGQCKMVSKELDGFDLVPVIPIDCEEDPEGLVGKYQVRNIPTLVLTTDEGESVHRFVGYNSKESIEEVIKQHLNG